MSASEVTQKSDSPQAKKRKLESDVANHSVSSALGATQISSNSDASGELKSRNSEKNHSQQKSKETMANGANKNGEIDAHAYSDEKQA